MPLAIKKGWLIADTTRVRLAAVTTYRPYAEGALEINTTSGHTFRFDVGVEPETTPLLPNEEIERRARTLGLEHTRQDLKRLGDERNERHLQKVRTQLDAILADLDAYFAKLP